MANILHVAAQLFASAGYESTTMTAIAEMSGSSIGALYQYFPNKEMIALALRKQYSDEMENRWTQLIDVAANLTIVELGEKIIDLMVAFLHDHPAYLNLLSAPLHYRRSNEERMRLRKKLATVFHSRNSRLSDMESIRIAQVTLEIAKSLNPLFTSQTKSEREYLVQEYKFALVSYLRTRLT